MLAPDVGLCCDRADLARDRLGLWPIEIRDDQCPGALGGDPERERAPDAASGTRDHDVSVGEVHPDEIS